MTEPRHVKVTVEFNPEDPAWLKEYVEAVDLLAKVVIEVFETNPVALLSPHLRQIVLDQAKRTMRKHDLVSQCLYVDNPGRPLESREPRPYGQPAEGGKR